MVPAGVECEVKGRKLYAKGKLGEAALSIHRLVKCTKEEEGFYFIPVEQSADSRALAGTMHRLARNMLIGVNDGFVRFLELRGIGYRVEMVGTQLKLALGFSHPVFYDLPQDIKAKVIDQTHFSVQGIDKQKVNQIAAEIRALRSPDPYKGKGVRYADETVILKETRKK